MMSEAQPMSIERNILLISEENDLNEQISKQLHESYPNLHKTTPLEVRKEIDRIAPDVVLILQSEEESGLDLIHYIHSEYESTIIMYIARKPDFQLLREVIRIGADDFFVLPDEMSAFNERFQRIMSMPRQEDVTKTQNMFSGQNMRRGRGQIISFYSGKGGSGCSLLASTFAQTLKFESTAQVLLIDMNLQFGGADMYLGIESNRSLADLKPVIEELNENHIRNVSEKEPFSKLEILLSPRDAEVAESLNEDFFTKLLRGCRRSYDYVIVDLPSSMNTNTYTALEESDLIYYVINLDTPSMQVYKYVNDLFKRLGMDTEERLKLVVNQKGRENELTPSDIKNFLVPQVAAEIRRDIKGVQSFVNKGEALRKEVKEKPLIPVAKDVRKWVLSILK